MTKLLQLIFNNQKASFVLCITLFIIGIFQGTSIPLNLSLSSLLPKNHQSVKDLSQVTSSLGGIGFLTVLIGPTNNPQQYLKPTNSIVQKLSDVSFSFYQKEKFLLKEKYLYIINYKKFKAIIKHAKNLFSDKQNSLDLISNDVRIKKKRIRKAKRYFKDIKSELEESEYYLSKDKKYAMLLIKPSFDATDLKKSKIFTTKLKQIIKTSIGSNIPFKFTGRYVDKVRNTNQFKKDIIFTGIISIVGITILMLLGLGSFSASIFVMIGVTMALGITTGIANIFVGQINILTGFLLAILGGLGSEYGIHFIRRYFQLIKKGQDKNQATHRTLMEMGKSLFSASLTSASAFLILIFSEFKGFSELGLIAGAGILVIYFTFILIFPLLISYVRPTTFLQKSIESFGYYPFNKRWALALLLFTPLLFLGINKIEFEYNFERMADSSPQTKKMNKLVNTLFEKSMTPAVFISNDFKKIKKIEEWIKEHDEKHLVDPIISLNTLIPRDMEKRYKKIKKLSQKVQKLTNVELYNKTGISANIIRNIVNMKPYGINQLPFHLQKMFGKNNNVIYLYPKEQMGQASAINHFSDFLKKIRKQFPGSIIGSGYLIFSDILRHIIKDGKIVLIMFLISAFIIFFLDFKSIKKAFLLEVQLISGLVLLCSLMGILDIRFTILNVAMIPAVLAAGIDIGVHIMHQEDIDLDPIISANNLAQAIQLSVLTTLFGFIALFFAKAKMLQSIAWISVLGQLSMYFICMIFIPVIKSRYFTNTKDKKIG